MTPINVGELAEALREAAEKKRTIALGGAGSKIRMAGPVAAAEVTVSTAGLNRVLGYEPRDLTVSVEAGVPWRALRETLAKNRQMLPLDPPFADTATVGGVVAANTCGPRRRMYGTARDFVIGMEFVTLAGKRVKSGGMVVKNVAGLDMAKLMIGSFGTLAAIASVNFKVVPMAEETRTFVWSGLHAVSGVLQPAATDVLNAEAARRVGLDGMVTLVRVGGTAAVLGRWEREMAGARVVTGEEEARLWRAVEEFTPTFLAEYEEGAVVRFSTTMTEQREMLGSLKGAVVARAGNGVTYAHFASAADAAIEVHAGTAVLEYGPRAARESMTLWPAPGDDFEMMRKVKALFDPENLMNRGRLYGRI